VVRDYETRIFKEDKAFNIVVEICATPNPLPASKEASTFHKEKKD
jgi:hypothetical protein